MQAHQPAGIAQVGAVFWFGRAAIVRVSGRCDAICRGRRRHAEDVIDPR